MNIRIRNIFYLSIAFLAVQLVLSKYVYPIIGKSTETMFAISPASGIGGTQVGNTMLSYLSGFTNFSFSLPVIALMFIGAFILTFLGSFIYDSKIGKSIAQGKNLAGRIFWILAYGHAALFVILYLLKMNTTGIAIPLLIGVFVNLVLVSMIVAFSATKLRFPKI